MKIKEYKDKYSEELKNCHTADEYGRVHALIFKDLASELLETAAKEDVKMLSGGFLYLLERFNQKGNDMRDEMKLCMSADWFKMTWFRFDEERLSDEK